MRTHFTLLSFVFTLFGSLTSSAQIQFWSDNLETAAPSSGSRTFTYSGGSGGPPNTRYCKQTPLSDISVNAPGYSGIEGSQCWAAEDIDAIPSGTPGEQPSEQNVTWGSTTSINIVGKTGLSFKGLFATGLTTVWDHGSSTTLQDYIVLQYSIDGGTWTTFLSFQPNAANTATGALAVDTDGDNLGDGATLSNTFTEFNATIAGTGSALQFRCMFSSNGLQEELAFDNFRLFEAAPCVAPVFNANPISQSMCIDNGTSFTASATGATAYQWQVDTGSGFTDVPNTAPYNGITTTMLNISAVTAAMDGYLYRLVAINGVGTCFTASTPATLTALNPSSSTITATTCDSYTLNGTTYTTSGTYTQLLWSSVGCDSTVTLNLTVDATPVAGITQTNAVTLQATGNGTAYQWINCSNNQPVAGATAASFTPAANGSYAVIVSNGSCSDTSTCMLIDEVGLGELSAAGITIAPNPASDVFTVRMTETAFANITLCDARGTMVLTVANAVSGQTIAVGNLQNGVYFVRIATAGGTFSERLVKQ